MKTLAAFIAVVSLAGCYNTYTREDLGDLEMEAVVIWTINGPHYHLRQWTIDDQGNVKGAGLTCTSTSTRFSHPSENASDFSGTIRKSNISTVKTSSSHASPVAILAVVLAVFVAGAAASGLQHWWH